MHAPILGSRRLLWHDETDCQACAGALARALGEPLAAIDAFIELRGPLGAGKTSFVRHLLRALGVSGRIKSPTYAVLEPYTLPGLSIAHIDFYRFADAREWVDAGLRDVFAAPGLKLVEWPEQVAGQLPQPDLRLCINPVAGGADERREVDVQALSERGLALLE
jgi:tRNA threonylcarbamoyladenosine biosynthesis protein TsaE